MRVRALSIDAPLVQDAGQQYCHEAKGRQTGGFRRDGRRQPPPRSITSRKPSSPQDIGDHSATCRMASGMTNLGTMMPPMAASRMLPVPPSSVACSVVRDTTAISSARPQRRDAQRGGDGSQRQPRTAHAQRLAAQQRHQPAARRQHQRHLQLVHRRSRG